MAACLEFPGILLATKETYGEVYRLIFTRRAPFLSGCLLVSAACFAAMILGVPTNYIWGDTPTPTLADPPITYLYFLGGYICTTLLPHVFAIAWYRAGLSDDEKVRLNFGRRELRFLSYVVVPGIMLALIHLGVTFAATKVEIPTFLTIVFTLSMPLVLYAILKLALIFPTLAMDIEGSPWDIISLSWVSMDGYVLRFATVSVLVAAPILGIVYVAPSLAAALETQFQTSYLFNTAWSSPAAIAFLAAFGNLVSISFGSATAATFFRYLVMDPEYLEYLLEIQAVQNDPESA